MTTKMEFEELIKLGFNKNEAKVYLALSQFKESDANQIIKYTKFHKNIVYDNLEKLINKGLVIFILSGKKRIFKLATSDAIINLFEEQEREIAEKKKIAINLSKELDSIKKKLPKKQEASIYKGKEGIKSFYSESLKNGDYVVFGAPLESIKIMGELFWQNYNLKRNEKKISVRMVFNQSIKEYGNSIKNKFTKIRYFDGNLEPLTETHIQKDKVAIIVWTEEPILFLIEDKFVAESYLRFFEEMWRNAKR